VSHELRVNGTTCDVGICMGSQGVKGAGQIDRIPEDNGGTEQIESRCAVTLVFEGAVTQFTLAMKEDGSGQSVSRFPFVESDLNATTQVCVLDPL